MSSSWKQEVADEPKISIKNRVKEIQVWPCKGAPKEFSKVYEVIK